MEPITLRLPNELLSELDEEASAAGFSSRSEYIRYVLQNRTRHAVPSTTDENTGTDTHSDKQLEEQVAALRRRVEALESGNGDSSDEDVFRRLEEWLDEELRSENARVIMLAAAEILSADGPMSSAELREELFDRYPERYSSASALWKATVERLYDDTPGYEKPEYGQYDFDADIARDEFDTFSE